MMMMMMMIIIIIVIIIIIIIELVQRNRLCRTISEALFEVYDNQSFHVRLIEKLAKTLEIQ